MVKPGKYSHKLCPKGILSYRGWRRSEAGCPGPCDTQKVVIYLASSIYRTLAYRLFGPTISKYVYVHDVVHDYTNVNQADGECCELG